MTKILNKKNPLHWCDTINFMKNPKSYEIKKFSPILAKFLKENYPNFVYNYKDLLRSKLEFSRTWSRKPFFRKIQNFIRSERSDGFFLNSLPNVLENWSLYKELLSSNHLDRPKFAATRAITNIKKKIQTDIKSQSMNQPHHISAWSSEWFLRYRSLSFPKF